MRLEELRIQRTPGIDDPFTLSGFAEQGCTLIHAPNGAGKSSSCRALQALLWPDPEDSEQRVVARWTIEGSSFRAELQGGRTEWQRDGSPSAAPRLPAAHLKDCFRLNVTDLLSASRVTDTGLAEALRSELAGGFRLDQVLANFRIGPQHGRLEAIALENQIKARDKVLRRFRDLAAEENRLAELGPELEASRQAQKLARVLERALRLAKARAELEQAERELATYPQEAGRLSGDEAKRLHALLAEERGLEAQLEECAARETEARRALEEAPQVPTAEELELAQTRIAAAERTLSELDRLLPEEGRAAAEEREALRALAGETPTGADPNLSPIALDELEDLLRETDTLRANRAAHEARRRQARKRPKDYGDPDVLNAACDLLRRYLSTTTAGTASSRNRRQLLVVALLGAALLATGLLLLQSEPVFGALALGASLALGAWALSLYIGQAGERELGAQIMTEYEDLGVVEPAEWNRKSVAMRLRGLQRELAHVEKAAAARDLYEEQQEELRLDAEELEGREATLADRRRKLSERSGLEVGDSALSLVEWSRRVAHYRQARTEIVRLDQRLDELRLELGRDAKALEPLIQEVRESEPAREWIARARTALSEMKRADEEESRAERDLSKAQQGRPRTETALQAKRSQRAELEALAGGDFGPGESPASRLEAWAAVAEVVSRASRQVQARRLAVEQDEAELRDFPELLNAQRDQLEFDLEAAEEQASRLEELIAEEQQLRAALQNAREGDELERANESCMEATLTLHDSLEEGRRRTVGAFLLEEVEREVEVESRPEVVREAALLFSRFTRHAYELRFDLAPEAGSGGDASERQPLRAFDVQSERGLAAHELSDGTRTQLLLAARMAFALHTSGGNRLPLLLDETLALSDPERFDAVALALFSIEDRQVFYFTSDVEVAARFDRLAAERDLPSPARIDLGAARGMTTAVQEARELALARPPRPLPSAALDADEFGARLGVPLADGERPLGEMHLFHVLRHDLRLLRTLLSAGKERVGHYQTLAKDLAALRALVPVQEERQRVEALIELTQVLRDAWSLGRGQRMTPEDLVRCKAVTAAFRDRLTEVLVEEKGWASGLVEALEAKRVSGYRKDKLQALVEWLEAEGYLDLRESLSDEAVLDRALAAMQPKVAQGILEPEFILPRTQELLASFHKTMTDRDSENERAFLQQRAEEEGASQTSSGSS